MPMTLTGPLKSSLGKLPLEGASLLVEAHSDDPADAERFCDLLREAVGRKGTLVVPTFTISRTLSDASPEPVPFQLDLAADRQLGSVPEVFRHRPDVLRTAHPTNSFAACGAQSQDLLSTNRDNNPLGPIKKLNLSNALCLRIGHPLHRSAALSLAEELGTPQVTFRSTANRINIAGFEERVVVHHSAFCTEGYRALEDELKAAVDDESLANSGPLQVAPLRIVVHAARAAIRSSPERILCGREGCPTCDRRRALLAGGEGRNGVATAEE